MPEFRTDRNNNPAALTTDIARQAGLILNKDYEMGDPFGNNHQFHTAKLLGNPIEQTIRIIDAVGFYTQSHQQRWLYIAIPDFVWSSLDKRTKIKVIKYMYQREGGQSLKPLFDEALSV